MNQRKNYLFWFAHEHLNFRLAVSKWFWNFSYLFFTKLRLYYTNVSGNQINIKYVQY